MCSCFLKCAFSYVRLYTSSSICLLVVCCRTTMASRGRKAEHVQEGGSFLKEKHLTTDDWGYIEVDHRVYLVVGEKKPPRIKGEWLWIPS